MRFPTTNVFWSGLEAAVAAVLSFSSAFAIARVIGPAEVGIGAAAASVHVMLWVGVNALFADALVQRPSVDAAMRSSALWAATAVGVAALVLQAAAGPLLAWALGDRRLVWMSLLLALPLPLVGAAGAVQGMLTRSRDYRALARRTLIGQGLGTLAGIAAAWHGAGAWSVVLQQTIVSGVGALALLSAIGWRPLPICDLAAVRTLLGVGLPLTASTLIQHARYRLFALLLGGTAGAAALGQVHMAFRLVDTVRDLAITALWRLMLPAMAERQSDPAALRARLSRFLALSALVLFPALAAMLVTIVPLVGLLLGPLWSPSAHAAALLLLLALWVVWSFPATVAMVACGRARPALFANLASLGLTLIGIVTLHPERPIAAALIWIAAQLAVAPYVLRVAARAVQGRMRHLLAAGLPPLLLAAAAAAVALLLPAALGEPAAPLPLIAMRLLSGGAVYIAGLLLCMPATLGDALRSFGISAGRARSLAGRRSDLGVPP